ncbi:FAD-dependent oxidoreductase, partial [Amycolatopsis sp. H20-H5]|uniref:FAD-dependent oxidoreductase n=1 Tax=Amycolatopsis sp. H20-H5 TaxID=3046309 RepID=UPI002DB9FFA6
RRRRFHRRGRGDVTLVEALPAPLAGVLGTEVAHELALLHQDNGVRLVCGTGVTRLLGDPAVTGVELADGRTLAADVVVLGLGVRPNTGWLAGSGIGLDADGGIRCDEYCAVDEYCAADSERTVYALGDVARCLDPVAGRHVRVEHWSNAVEQAATVVRNLVEPSPVAHRHQPFFWSDQYGGKLQLLGYPDPADTVTVVHGAGPRRRFAVAYQQGPLLRAVLTLNWPKALMAARRAGFTPGAAADVVAEWKNL